VPSELHRKGPAEGLDGAEGDLQPAQVVVGQRVAVAAEEEDHP
jgi:hypothetical protein